jgi:hypothetical protein
MIRPLPLFQFRDRLSPLLTQADPLQEMRRRSQRSGLIEKTLTEENGFWVWKAQDPRRCGQSIPPPVQGLVTYRDRPQAEDALKLAVQKLGQRGLRVYLVYIPFSEVWVSLTEPGIDGRVQNVMRRIGSQAEVLETPDVREYRGLFHDWTHLNYCGAEKYTSWLLQQMRL